jgi:hypothetical protein
MSPERAVPQRGQNRRPDPVGFVGCAGCSPDSTPHLPPIILDVSDRDRIKRGGSVVKIWSELPAAQSREVVADAATTLWVIFWASVAIQLYSLLSSFAHAGRLIQEGGVNLRNAGADISANTSGVPVVGKELSGVVKSSITAAANPFVDFGIELETLIFVLAVAISLLVLAVPLVPWLFKYLPWRIARLRRVRAANRVTRSSGLPSGAAEKILAARAVYSLDYQTLLDYSPDPFGDFAKGRHDRLARAELATVGLKLRR